MTDVTHTIGLEALNESERAALQMGTDMYRASVVQELDLLLTELGVPEDVRAVTALTVAEHGRGKSLLDTQEAAHTLKTQRQGYFAGVVVSRQVLIDVSATGEAEQVQLADVASPEPDQQATLFDRVAATTAVIEPAHHATEAEDATLDSIDATNDASPDVVVEAEPIAKHSVKALKQFFGDDFEDNIKAMSAEQAVACVNHIADWLIENKKIFPRLQESRRQHMMSRIIDGAPWKSLDRDYEHAMQAISNHAIYVRSLPVDQKRVLLNPVHTLETQVPTVVTPEVHADSIVDLAIDPTNLVTNTLHNAAVLKRSHNLLNKIFGDELSDITSDTTLEDFYKVVELLGDIMRLKGGTKLAMGFPQRVADFESIVIDGKTWTEISKSQGMSPSYAIKMTVRLIEKLKSLYTASDLRQLLESRLHSTTTEESGAAESNTQIQPEIDVATNEDIVTVEAEALPEPKMTVPEVQQPARPKTETIASNDPFDELGSILGYSDDKTFRLFKSLFDTNRLNPDYSKEAAEIYRDIAMFLDFARDAKRFHAFVNSLEFRALELIVRGAGDKSPLAPKSVQKIISNDLAKAKRKFEAVLQTGLMQLAETRKDSRR